MRNPTSCWFGAKRYLFGWGVPVRWQGWAVFVAFIVAELMGPAVFAAHRQSLLFAIYSAAVLSAFLVVCVVKGEMSS